MFQLPHSRYKVGVKGSSPLSFKANAYPHHL